MIEEGPYLQAAALCERLLEEKDSVLTLVRLIDQVSLLPFTPAAGVIYPPYIIWAVLTFKSGSVQGTRTVTLRTPPQLGLTKPDTSVEVTFEGGIKGVNVMIQMSITPGRAQGGDHWLDVVLDEQIVTRVPLRITYGQAAEHDSQAALSLEGTLDAEEVEPTGGSSVGAGIDTDDDAV